MSNAEEIEDLMYDSEPSSHYNSFSSVGFPHSIPLMFKYGHMQWDTQTNTEMTFTEGFSLVFNQLWSLTVQFEHVS